MLRSAAVAEAFATAPRHVFVPEVSVDEAYRDQVIPTKRLADGEVVSSSSQPEIMAIMLEQLDVRPGQRVLEIGAGTGYNAALLDHLVGPTGSVTAVDIDDDTVEAARAHLAAAGVTRVRVVCGDGWEGLAEDAPYDRIILTVGAHDIAPAWRTQLALLGRLVLPLALPGVQASIAFTLRSGMLESVAVQGCLFMRLRGTAAHAYRRVPVGPEPAPAVWPRGDHIVDGDAVYASLRTPPMELTTDLVVPTREVYNAIAVWLALREPGSAWFTADGLAVGTPLLPTLLEAPGTQRSTFGVFEPDGVALLARLATNAGEDAGNIALGVRAHGDAAVGERLRDAVLVWDRAGRPGLRTLRVRAMPIAQPYAPRAGETVVTRPCTRLVLDWPAVAQ